MSQEAHRNLLAIPMSEPIPPPLDWLPMYILKAIAAALFTALCLSAWGA